MVDSFKRDRRLAIASVHTQVGSLEVTLAWATTTMKSVITPVTIVGTS